MWTRIAVAQPGVAVVVLNYHRFLDTRECLSSVFASADPSVRVILLDLGSSSDQLASLQGTHPRLQVVPLSENRGYAGNNNIGVRLALDQGADWVLLLNEDTRIDPRCMAELMAAVEARPNAGVVGPLVCHYDSPAVIQSSGGRLDARWRSFHLSQDEPDRGQLTEVRQVDWVAGCAMQMRRGLIERIGLLDERFFNYWEETEFCLRARRNGWEILNAPRAKVWHKGGRAGRPVDPSVGYYMTRNRFLFLARHRAPLSAWITAWAETLRTLAAMTARPNSPATAAHRAAVTQGIRDFLRQRGGPMPLARR